MEEIKKINYYSSLNKVLEFIDHNLSEELSLNLLSKIASYSEFHFHRIFHSMMGKNVLEYVLERKYISAASRVLYDKSSTLTQIALEYGFTSSSNFSRGFKQYFKCSPSEYKRNKDRARPVEIPIGRNSIGLPIGVQIVGKRNREYDLLQSAKELCKYEA